MKKRSVEFAPEARDDLIALYDWIADRAGGRVAMDYIGRIESFCAKFDIASERGTRRDDIRKGLRVVAFERRINVAFVVEDDRVVILRLFNGGRDWGMPDHWEKSV